MEKDWPNLEECPQYRYGLLDAALYRYPWEEDGYEFDFSSVYPPIPDEPPWFRKVVESTKDNVWPPSTEEDIHLCPICLPCRKAEMIKSPRIKSPPINYNDPRPLPVPRMDERERERQMEMEKKKKKEIREDPTWKMDSIPCPFHIRNHFYAPLPGALVSRSPPSLVTREQLESTKQFLKELRATRGYNVKSTKHPSLVTSHHFKQENLDQIMSYDRGRTRREVLVEYYSKALIDHIDFKTGKIYTFVDIVKFVPVHPYFLLTFSAAASPAAGETFVATVSHGPGQNPKILECLLLPNDEAPCKTQPLDEEAIRKASFEFIERLMTSYLGDAEMTNESSTLKRECVEVGEGSDTSAQKQGPCVVEDLLAASEEEMLPKVVEDEKIKQELEFELLRKRKLELEAELKEVVAKLSSHGL